MNDNFKHYGRVRFHPEFGADTKKLHWNAHSYHDEDAFWNSKPLLALLTKRFSSGGIFCPEKFWVNERLDAKLSILREKCSFPLPEEEFLIGICFLRNQKDYLALTTDRIILPGEENEIMYSHLYVGIDGIYKKENAFAKAQLVYPVTMPKVPLLYQLLSELSAAFHPCRGENAIHPLCGEERSQQYAYLKCLCLVQLSCDGISGYGIQRLQEISDIFCIPKSYFMQQMIKECNMATESIAQKIQDLLLYIMPQYHAALYFDCLTHLPAGKKCALPEIMLKMAEYINPSNASRMVQEASHLFPIVTHFRKMREIQGLSTDLKNEYALYMALCSQYHSAFAEIEGDFMYE